jgi:hypothetical protein
VPLPALLIGNNKVICQEPNIIDLKLVSSTYNFEQKSYTFHNIIGTPIISSIRIPQSSDPFNHVRTQITQQTIKTKKEKI